MALTQSTMMELGTTAPDFTLPDTVSGRDVSLSDVQSDVATVVMFICNHCPYVKHVQDELVRLANDFTKNGMSFVAISSNDAENYPDDGPAQMKQIAEEWRYPFPYLYDESQATARAYHAACTPDFFVFDKDLQCVYRGRLDASSPGNDIPVTGGDLRRALDNVLGGTPVDPDQSPSMGCNIKWK